MSSSPIVQGGWKRWAPGLRELTPRREKSKSGRGVTQPRGKPVGPSQYFTKSSTFGSLPFRAAASRHRRSVSILNTQRKSAYTKSWRKYLGSFSCSSKRNRRRGRRRSTRSTLNWASCGDFGGSICREMEQGEIIIQSLGETEKCFTFTKNSYPASVNYCPNIIIFDTQSVSTRLLIRVSQVPPL